MTRRALPEFKPGFPVRAPHLQKVANEVGRITGLPTGGDDEFVDNACGRFYLPNGSRATAVVPVEITEVSEDYGSGYDEPVAIYRTSHPYGFYVRKLDSDREMTGDEFLCHAHFITGVHWTGKQVWAVKVSGRWELVTDGADYWRRGMTLEAIEASTEETVTEGEAELFSAGPVVMVSSDSGIAIDTLIDIGFDEEDQSFKATAQRCPPAPAEES